VTNPRMRFISGLPRSGSTLLSALLRQNPRLAAGVTSPVASLITAVLPKMSGPGEFAAFFDDQRRRDVLRGMFDGYYAKAPRGGVVFDTNRNWTARVSLLLDLYPDTRIVCLVRDVGWILDSIERQLRRHPLHVSRALNFQAGSSVYARVEMLMNSDTGLVGQAWSALREAWFGDHANKLIVIDYDRFVRDPAPITRALYHALGEPAFAHDYDNVAFDEPDYDATLGMPGLHTVRPKVAHQPRPPCIPPDLFEKYAESAFWVRPEMNRRGAVVL